MNQMNEAGSVIKELKEMFKDDERGFDVFVLMKDKEHSVKKILFYEALDSFKNKIETSITETIHNSFLSDESQYEMAENIANEQDRVYIISQDDSYNPFGFLKDIEETNDVFNVNDYDNADAILFRYRKNETNIWAYQSVNPILIPNKKKENFLTKILKTEEGDRFVEMTDDIFTITKKINIIIMDQYIITKDINLMQRHFGFESFIRMQATKVVSEIEVIDIVSNTEKLYDYIGRTKKTYAKKMMRIKQYNVINKTREELIMKITTVERWKDVFEISDGRINIRTYEDVENLIDLFDERYTKSLITDDEFDTDVKKLV